MWTCELLPFTYQQCSLLHPFLPLKSLDVSGEVQSALCHGKTAPCLHAFFAVRSTGADTGNIGEGPQMDLQINAHFA